VLRAVLRLTPHLASCIYHCCSLWFVH